ncbi:hypothetical protein AXF42_Ash006047 [Apostasia shenzhenica]|uniref:MRN complex-interacting protein N-terminal domain-containing protein n=1 Tax=Apostasia shenzhenica TaxID=1088818 RepID=A0A2I0B030_9ASPA|nr:hypothetical protein AXF42_Ash006047 [Apostasia shenzhenica]
MSTIFIAVQCIQCSTMQVKQQKKSSNKWVCAVCNQRQSFRRIHARGYLARDLRKFVQEFNLSRSVQEASHNASVTGRSDEFLVGSEIGDSSSCGGIACWLGKRRMDWSEYLDPKEDDHRADAGEGLDIGHFQKEPLFLTTKMRCRLSPNNALQWRWHNLMTNYKTSKFIAGELRRYCGLTQQLDIEWLLEELRHCQVYYPLHCDSEIAIHLANNLSSIQNQSTKRFAINEEGATVAKGIGGSGTVVEQGLSKWRKYLEDEDRGDGDNPFKQEKSHLFLSHAPPTFLASDMCLSPLLDRSALSGILASGFNTGSKEPFVMHLFRTSLAEVSLLAAFCLYPTEINSSLTVLTLFLQNSGKHVLIFLISAVAQVYGE